MGDLIADTLVRSEYPTIASGKFDDISGPEESRLAQPLSLEGH